MAACEYLEVSTVDTTLLERVIFAYPRDINAVRGFRTSRHAVFEARCIYHRGVVIKAIIVALDHESRVAIVLHFTINIRALHGGHHCSVARVLSIRESGGLQRKQKAGEENAHNGRKRQ